MSNYTVGVECNHRTIRSRKNVGVKFKNFQKVHWLFIFIFTRE